MRTHVRRREIRLGDGDKDWKERALKAERKLEELDTTVAEDKPTGFKQREEVFAKWKEVFKKKRGVFRSGDKRDRTISQRLKNWNLSELTKAIEGFSMDPWRHGHLNRHELATLLRNDGQVEAGVEIYEDGGERVQHQRSDRGHSGNKTIDYTDKDRGNSSRVAGFTEGSLQRTATGRNCLPGNGDLEDDLF